VGGEWEFSDEGRLEETYRQLYIDQWKQSLSAEYSKRLNLLYPKSHEMSGLPEQFRHLKINLNRAIN